MRGLGPLKSWYPGSGSISELWRPVTETFMIRLKRVYDPTDPRDGRRFLVERLWPRGIRKEQLRMDGWVKEAAPSDALRRWFGHDPAKWDEFRCRYDAELEKNPGAWQVLLDAAHGGDMTLLFSSHDLEHNNAVALLEFLQKHLDQHL